MNMCIVSSIAFWQLIFIKPIATSPLNERRAQDFDAVVGIFLEVFVSNGRLEQSWCANPINKFQKRPAFPAKDRVEGSLQ